MEHTFDSGANNDHLAVVLVEPRQPGNIGMVCRAMANFGIHDLRLVNPCQHLHPEAHKFAVFASDLLGQAKVFPTLEQAMSDLTLTLAATRRPGRLRGELLSVRNLPDILAASGVQGKVGLVFGREDAGLTTTEVGLCDHAITIPSAGQNGSLNLAQAVLIFLYEAFAPLNPDQPQDRHDDASQGELNGMFQEMEGVLERIALTNPARPESVAHPLRQIFRRARLTSAEAGLLRGVWSQLSWSIRDWRGPRKGNSHGPG